MTKVRPTAKNELRAEYKRADFKGPFVRGKYARRLDGASNVVVLRPEIAVAFPNDEAVNDALSSLLELARRVPLPKKRNRPAAK